MPIWNPDCRGDDHAAVHQTYIRSLTEIVDPVLQAITAPCDAWGVVLGGLLGAVNKRLESQAGVCGRRVKACAAQLDALGPPPGLVVTEDTAAQPPLIALETGGGAVESSPVMAVQEAPEAILDAGRAVDPKEPTDLYSYWFGERRAPWHRAAAEWSGGGLVNPRDYPSLAAMIQARTDGPLPGGPVDPTIPDVY